MKELAPKLSLHREEKKPIEDFLEKVATPEFIEEAMVAFFGLYNVDENGNFTPSTKLISKQEQEDFRIFFLHVVKRILSAHSRKYEGALEHSYNKREAITSLTESKNIPIIFSTLFHDLSHSVGQIIKNKDFQGGTVVQPFLRHPIDEDYNKKENIEDELRGFIFGSLYYPMPTAVRSKLHLTKSHTFEEFRGNFLKSTIKAALTDNNELITRYHDHHPRNFSLERFEEQNNLESEAKKIADEIISSPPEDVERMLEYIWEHREESRVLIDLFFNEIKPYIDRLKARKIYQQENNEGKK
jgi:hypothetical protein